MNIKEPIKTSDHEIFNQNKVCVRNDFHIYDQRLYFEGKDEFYEISLVFNEMAEKLNINKQKMSVTLQEEYGNEAILKIKSLEEKTAELISKIEKR